MSQTVLIVEDDDLVVRFLGRTLPEHFPDLDMIVARSFAEAVATLEEFHIAGRVLDAAVLDLRLPDGMGDELIPFVWQHAPNARLVVASAFMDEDTSCRLQLLGVLVLRKQLTPERLRVALTAEPAGNSLRLAIESFARYYEFSKRQRYVLEGIFAKKTLGEMALEGGIEISTVEEHYQRILKITGCKSRPDLFLAVFELAHPLRGGLDARRKPARCAGK